MPPGTRRPAPIPIDRFFIAEPERLRRDRSTTLLARGENLILTPGVYDLDRTIDVKRPGTVVLGLGFPTLVPTDGDAAMKVADVPGSRSPG